MSQVMIIAKMQPEHAGDVAGIFGRYDATDMPHEIGVARRSLYRFHGLYVHLIDFNRPVPEAMATAQSLPAFGEMSLALRPFIEAYDPNWRSPADAMASRFYSWTPTGGINAASDGSPSHDATRPDSTGPDPTSSDTTSSGTTSNSAATTAPLRTQP